MRLLLFIIALCILGCKATPDTKTEGPTAEVSYKRGEVIPEPPKFTLPPGAPFETRDVCRYYETIREKGYDTIQVREYVLDTAKVFLYACDGEFNDTLIIGNNSVSSRRNRAWGYWRTKFLERKNLKFKGQNIVIEKYVYMNGLSRGNMFINDSLGIIIKRGLGQGDPPSTVLYNSNDYKELHNIIMKDTSFFIFE